MARHLRTKAPKREGLNDSNFPRDTIKVTFLFLMATLASIHFQHGWAEEIDEAKHLFILSGQSNMQGLRPEESFTPAVEEAFGKANVIVVKDAQGGQPIRRWYKGWNNLSDRSAKAEQIGDLYDRIMQKVTAATKNQQIQSVTLIWMQGERDAREQHGDVYAECLKGLRKQICDDLDRKEINLVIGRLSDFDMNNKRYRHWTKIRQVQVDFADSNVRTEWVDTDDLNDGKNRQGKNIENDLHYSAEGYKVLGDRFAEKAIWLIRAGQK